MFAFKPRTEIAFRVFMIAVMLVDALIPTVALAAPEQVSNSGVENAVSRNLPPALPEHRPAFYNVPEIKYPQQTSPEPDRTKPPVPPKNQVEFTLMTEPAIVPANGLVNFHVHIHNHSAGELTSLVFSDSLESGLIYSPDSSRPVIFDSKKKEVTLTLDHLGAGDEFNFSYPVTVDSSKRNAVKGKIWLHNVELNSPENNLHLKTGAVMAVELANADTRSELVPLNPQGGWNTLGRVAVHMEKENVGKNALVMSSPIQVNGKGPALQFQLDMFETNSLAVDAQSNFDEQTINLAKQNKTAFKKPAFLEINLDGYADLKNIPAGQEPYVATYDETNEIWIKVPILETDRESNSVTVEAAHFSTWGAGLGNALPQNGANVLLFDQPYTSLFTGAARYSIPIWTPPGRGGMQPDLSLSYSSSTVDGVLGDVQAPWVGVGWNMDQAEIVRTITTSETGYGYENNFALTINGTLYDLLVNPSDPRRYFTKTSSFLYIERHNFALGNQEDAVHHVTPNLGSDDNPTGEWWEVITTDGTRYRLGWNADSQQLALMYGYSCSTNGNACVTPDGAYASLGYAGLGHDLVAMRWRVDKVVDRYGNSISYTYEEQHPASTMLPQFDRASYLKSIKYTDHPSAPSKYLVEFVYAARPGDVPDEFNTWDNVDSQLLDQIQICYTVCSGNNVIRTYDLGYTVQNVPNSNGTLTLTELQISGGNFEADGVSSSSLVSPKIKFTYENKSNRAASGSRDVFTYPRLTKIENGYGGSLSFTYENDGRTFWYNYRVKNAIVSTGAGTAANRGYTYVTPVYAYPDGTGALTGYTDVTETTYNFDGTTKISESAHHFGTAGLDTGYELVAETKDASGTVLQKTVSTYVTDNSQAPFEGWNYRYLGQAANYVRSGTALILTSKTVYVHDGGTGNLRIQQDYIGNTLYRKQYYEYRTNPYPDVYILDKVSRQLLLDAGNQIVSDTRYIYDNNAEDLSGGELTLVQKLLDETTTSDTYYEYDPYGNVRRTCAYKTYGVAGVIPTGGICSETVYDDIVHTYPVISKDPLGQATVTDYIFQLGVPHRVTGPNGVIDLEQGTYDDDWATVTTYDRLGRTLSATPPGLPAGKAGTKYTYPPVINDAVPAPYHVKMELWDGTANLYRPVWGIYDGMGRLLETQTWDSDRGEVLVSESHFNAQGLVEDQSLPYYSNTAGGTYVQGGSQFTHTVYDALGRSTQVTAPGNITSSTQYNGLITTSIDPNGHKAVRTTDGLGRMKYVQEYDEDKLYATTAFSYDAADRLIKTTDAQGNTTALKYDTLGRKTGMDDPDMGTAGTLTDENWGWRYVYDALGNMISQTDARGRQLTFVYDDLNRLTTKSDDDPSTGNIGYTYGTEAGERGMRVAMTDQNGSITTWHYPGADFGRTVEEERTIGEEQRTFTTTSDWLGRILTLTYPDSEIVTYQYDALGRAKSFKSDQNTFDFATLGYNQLSQIMTINLGNGARVENTYNTTTHRLDQRVALANGNTLLDFRYTYDAAGNITKLIDTPLEETHTYRYDSLNRLTSAEAIKGTDYAYRQSFEYDKVGNILSRQDWQVSDLIFKDDFEDPLLAAWTVSDPGKIWTIPSNGFLPVSGERSVVFDVESPNPLYLTDSHPGSNGNGLQYRARFYLHPNSINMAASDVLDLLTGSRIDGTQVFRVQMQKDTGAYQVRAGALNDSNLWTDSDWQSISNQWTAIEVSYSAAAGSGSLALWVNGGSAYTLSNVDNDTHPIDHVQLGTMGVEAGTQGQILFDAFESRRLSYIGLVPGQMAKRESIVPVAYHLSSDGLNVLQDAPLVQIPDTPIPTATSTPSPTGTSMPTPLPPLTRTLMPTVPGYALDDDYTVSLLHMNAAGASTVFWDESARLWTAAGNARIDTAQSKFGGASALFAGAGGYINTADSADWDTGPGDFTVDLWVRWNVVANSGLYSHGLTDGNRDTLFYDSGRIGWSYYTDSALKAGYTFDFTPAAGTWYHIALVRAGPAVYMFLNGVSQSLTTYSPVGTKSLSGISDTFNLGVGRFNGTTNYLDGWIDEFRYSKGIARWTSTFLPAGAGYPAPAPTTTFTPTDPSTPTKTFTPSLTPTPSRTPTPTLSPNPAAAWLLDDPLGDAIVRDAVGAPFSHGTLANNAERVPGFGTNAVRLAPPQYINIPRTAEMEPATGFTISMWLFPTEIQQDKTYIILNKGTTAQDYRLYINKYRLLVLRVSALSPNELVGPVLPLNRWTHVTAVYDRPAGMLKLFMDGALVASRKVTGTISYTSGGITLGASLNGFVGMIDEVYLNKGALLETPIADTATAVSTLTPRPTWTPSSTPVSGTVTPTHTPTPTALPAPDDRLRGTGADGDLSVAAGVIYNLNTQNHAGRPCADAVAYSLTNLGSTGATLDVTPAEGCLQAGDEILLINLQGNPYQNYNTGAYEFLRVASVDREHKQVAFTAPKLNWYGSVAFSDANIGTEEGRQHVMLMRVPNYENVTVQGQLTGSAWDENKLGVVAFRVHGMLSGSGTISASRLGYGSTTGYAGWNAGAVYGGGALGLDTPGGGRSGGGGGYGTDGTSGDSAGGSAYGQLQLNRLFQGGGGGTGGRCTSCDLEDRPGGTGGRGGGILWIGAYTVDFQGSLTAEGGNGSDSPGGGGAGGGGAGGSIRIEGYTITLNTVSAAGAGYYADGGQGRTALYYQGPPPSIPSNVSIGSIAKYTGAVPVTPLPVLTPISLAPPSIGGTGADGSLTVAAGTTYNLNTQSSNDRVCADGGDGVAYSVFELSDSWAKLYPTPANGCLKQGDEVLLINLQGTNAYHDNAGRYEFLRVGSLQGNQVYFASAKLNSYGARLEEDSNIGVATGQQRVMLLRVPNYDTVTVDGTLTANTFNGDKYGMVALRVKGTLQSSNAGGTISVSSLGYGSTTGFAGPGTAYGGGAAGEDTPGGGRSGGGGGYGTGGNSGDSAGGNAFGQPGLDLLFSGGGGGKGGRCANCNPENQEGGAGGRGGGILWIGAGTISFSGSLTANGANGSDSTGGGGTGGAGAGGSIRIEADTVTALDTVSVTGATYGADGGEGRTAVYYQTQYNGSFVPGYVQKQDTPDTLFKSDFESGGLADWTAHTENVTVSDSAGYWGGHGLSVALAGTTPVYIQDETPAQETGYRARFYVHPDNLAMADGAAVDLFTGYNGSTDSFHVQVQKNNSFYRDDVDQAMEYSGTWTASTNAGANAGTYSYSSTVGDSVSYRLSGERFDLLYTRLSTGGKLEVYIDDVKVDTIDQYALSPTWQNTWHSPALRNTTHVVKLVHASGSSVNFDAVHVFNKFQLRAGLLNDAGAWTETSWYDIPDSWSAVEVDYHALVNSGSLTLWLDDVQKHALRYIDNDTRALTEVRLGAQGIETGTSGTLYFDDFESRRFSYIGRLPDLGVEDIEAAPQAGWQDTAYHYDGAQPHAVTSLTRDQSSAGTYEYDANGNMTCRVEGDAIFRQNYNAENRISSIAKIKGNCGNAGAEILEVWAYAYDGDGTRVSTAHFTGLTTTPDSFSAYFLGGAYEITNGAVKKYYSIDGMMVAMRTWDAEQETWQLSYFLTDHLGSTVALMTSNQSGGWETTQQRYLPFGQARELPDYSPIRQTDFTYTGQRDLPGTGLMDYKARFYSPYLNRFIQPDTIIPNAKKPQTWNRYIYVNNNPVNLKDPSGHVADCANVPTYSGAQATCNVLANTSSGTLIKIIEDKFGITIDDDDPAIKWNISNLRNAYSALNIANEALNGKLKAMVGGTTFAMEWQAQCRVRPRGNRDCYHGITSSTGVTYYSSNTNLQIPIINFLHETAHLLDYVPATNNAFSGSLPENPSWVKDGYVNSDLLLGKVVEPIQAEPMNEPNDPHEYWADAFANYAYGNVDLGQSAGTDMANDIANALRPYINP